MRTRPVLFLLSLLTLATLASASASTLVPRQLFTFGSSGNGNGQFDFPQSVAINRTLGLIYVSDTNNHRIQVFTLNGTYIGQWGALGAGNGQLNAPGGIAIAESTGTVYVADYGNNRVQYFSALGAYAGKWGTFGVGNGQFTGPNGIAFHAPTGTVYVSEFGGNRVQYFTAAGVFLGKWGSNSVFSSPGAVAVDPDANRVFVTEYNGGEVQRFSLAGDAQASWTENRPGVLFSQPAGVAVDDAGRVIVADRTAPISVFDASGKRLGGFGVSGLGPGEFQSPYSVATGDDGLVLVCDSASNYVSALQITFVNQSPIVRISGKARVVTSAASRRLRGTVTDPDGTIQTLRIKAGRKPAKSIAFAGSRWSTRVALRPGRNRVFVTATDDERGAATPARLLVTRR